MPILLRHRSNPIKIKVSLARYCSLYLLALTHVVFASEDAWSRFRGPDGSGISDSKKIPISWEAKDYLWKTTLAGKGHSSPVIWKDKLFVLSGDSVKATRILQCLEAFNGNELWRRDFPSSSYPQNRDNSFGSSTPAVDKNAVYLYWTTPKSITVLALNHQGQELWKRDLGTFTGRHGSGTSPIVYKDFLIINNDQEGPSSLLALDCKTGKTEWTIPRITDQTAYSTPFIFHSQSGADELIFTSSGHGITSVNPLAGTVLWEYKNAFPMRVVGSAVASSNLVIGLCGEGGTGKRLAAIRAGSKTSSPELVYEMKSSIPYVPSPVLKDSRLYLWGDNGLVSCFYAETGQKIWQGRLENTFYGSPIWIDGRLYCMSRQGNLFIVRAGDQYELMAKIPLGEESHATPAVANDILYLRTFTTLMAVRQKE